MLLQRQSRWSPTLLTAPGLSAKRRHSADGRRLGTVDRGVCMGSVALFRFRRGLPAVCVALALFGAASRPAAAQDTVAEEAAHRAALLAHLPPDAAQRVFGLETAPAPGPAEAIGAYERGCLEGAVELPADGPNWQVMRPSRNRAWGHPALIAVIERIAAKMPQAAGWPGLLIGDIAQPRGGPMLTGHGSHQIGLDADIWLTPMPNRRLSSAERDEMSATDVVAADGLHVDPTVWNPSYRKMYEAVAHEPQVERVLVNPAIKRQLCEEAGADRAWLAKIRPWWGHNYHFHMRISCLPGQSECQSQAPPPLGDGCGKQLAWWFTPEALHPPPSHAKPLLMGNLPRACRAVAEAPAVSAETTKAR
jgi:penicillin-insensitive murein endopeptidase